MRLIGHGAHHVLSVPLAQAHRLRGLAHRSKSTTDMGYEIMRPHADDDMRCMYISRPSCSFSSLVFLFCTYYGYWNQNHELPGVLDTDG